MSIRWNSALNDLVELLADLYSDPENARFVVRRAELDPAEIDFRGPPKILWLRIVEEANRRDAVAALVNLARADFPNVNFDALEAQLLRPGPPSAPRPGDWKGAPALDGGLERVIGSQPTFLPVSFLTQGLLRARSVARIESPQGLGTGFLTQSNLLITNHHVLPSPADAEKATVWLNYQKTATGTDAEVTELRLDPKTAFETSPVEDDDWTAVRVRGQPNAKWGALDLVDVSVAVDDFVNIVQHPAGMPKQIALYHNVVVFADDRRVQYLTDTMPGSSGSPVFDSKWRVVALHHSGGWLRQPGTDRVFFRNQGIHVRALIRGLKARGISVAGGIET